jgi:hypothetical protein
MTEEKKEAWLNYLALMSVIFAVCEPCLHLKAEDIPPVL